MGTLVNAGKVYMLNLHSYHDSRPRKPHFSNIDDSSEWAPSCNFLRAKRAAGITRPVRFAAGEFNYRNWDGSGADSCHTPKNLAFHRKLLNLLQMFC